MTRKLDITVVDGRYALSQLPPSDPIPSWVRGQFAAMIFSKDGISVVCEESDVPAGVKTQAGFRCLEVGGLFDLASVGVIAALVQPLAAAGISLFAYSTWQTDYILVQEEDLHVATVALAEAGHLVRKN